MLLRHSIGLAFLLTPFVLQAAPGDNVYGRWSQQFGWPIIPAHATLLPNGKVLSFGTNQQGVQGAQFNYAVWDPSAGFGAHQVLPNYTATDIFCAATGLLPNGDVLISGGDTRNPVNVGIKDTIIFKTGNQTLERAAYMQFARWYPTMTTLPSGEMLVHGGREWDGQPIHAPEVFSNGNYRTIWGAYNEQITSNEEGKWFYPRNFIAPNGRVFGLSGNLMYFLDWGGNGGQQVAGYLPNKSRSHISTAVMYEPGKIFQAGGSTNGDTQAQGSNQAITVDVTSGWPVVQDLPNMSQRRVWGNSTVLPNGEVLVTGGSAYENKLIDNAQMAEMWNPNTRQFRNLRAAATPRLYHSISLLLQDGSVLVGGGGAPGPLNNLNAEVYYPPYLFDGNGNFAERPVLGNFQQQQNYGQTINVGFERADGISRVSLIRTGSVTHSFDMSQRFQSLAFRQNGNQLSITLPDSANIAPPGYYLLFILNNQGVPSVAKMVSLGGGAVPAAPTPTAPSGNGLPGGLNLGQDYQVVSAFSNKCVDVDKGDAANGTNVLQWECGGAANQKFKIQAAGNNTFNLVNAATGKCVDVEGPSATDGANVHQWECNGGLNQAVRFEAAGNGSYKLKFEHSGKCMDIAGPSAANGTNVHQWQCLGDAASQNFFFRP